MTTDFRSTEPDEISFTGESGSTIMSHEPSSTQPTRASVKPVFTEMKGERMSEKFNPTPPSKTPPKNKRRKVDSLLL